MFGLHVCLASTLFALPLALLDVYAISMLFLCYLYAMAELCVVVLQESRTCEETWTICSPDPHRDLSWTCSAEASGLHSWYNWLYILTYMNTPVVIFGSAVTYASIHVLIVLPVFDDSLFPSAIFDMVGCIATYVSVALVFFCSAVTYAFLDLPMFLATTTVLDTLPSAAGLRRQQTVEDDAAVMRLLCAEVRACQRDFEEARCAPEFFGKNR